MEQSVKWIVDRIEGEYAVVELMEQAMADIPKAALPDGVRAGDVLTVSVDRDETHNRKQKIERLADRLFK